MPQKKFFNYKKLTYKCLPALIPALLLLLVFSAPAPAAPISRFLNTMFGPDDFQISDMGPGTTTGYEASSPAAVYNTSRDEFLVVWAGPNQDLIGDWYSDREIWYQRVDKDGSLIDSNEKLTQTGDYDDADFHAWSPDVAYNPFRDEFIVVWEDNSRECSDGRNKSDIAGQRLYYNSSGNLRPIGSIISISYMGPRPADCSYKAHNPAVAYNWINQEYMVVWEGAHHTGGTSEFEIWGQRLEEATLAKVGDMIRISSMGPDYNNDYDARKPDIDHNRLPFPYNEYLVVWEGDTNLGSYVNEEYEIWSERVAADGSLLGTLVMSDVGGSPGSSAYDAYEPSVVYNSEKNRWLVVWYGDDIVPGDGQYEIYGQQVKYNSSNNLIGVGPNDFRISSLGTDGTANPDAWYPAVAYDYPSNYYVVVWQDRDNAPGSDWYEIHGQRILDEPTSLVEPDGFQISEMGPPTNTDYFARRPAIASSSTNGFLLAVWEGTDPTYTGINDWEIFGQLFYGLVDTYLPAVFKN